MEFLPLIRLIWRSRLLLAAGAFCAACTLVALGGTKLVTNNSALAWTRVAIDTPKSQLVDAAPVGADTLTWRAALLTDLIATDALTRYIAERVGVKADRVLVINSNLSEPLVATNLAQDASMAASQDVRPYTLTTALDNDVLPVITLQAAAPDPAGAGRLLTAAVAVLESQSSPGGTFTSHVATGGRVFKLQPFTVHQVTPTRVKLLSSSSPPLKAIAAAVTIFALWVAGGLTIRRLTRRQRAAGQILTT